MLPNDAQGKVGWACDCGKLVLKIESGRNQVAKGWGRWVQEIREDQVQEAWGVRDL